MYEYNVKKNSEDRREFKLTIASIQENNIKIVETLKAELPSNTEVSTLKETCDAASEVYQHLKAYTP